jgi:hypothetical protein
VSRQARIIDATLRDRALTGLVAVATPEEMPVNELGFLRAELGDRLDLVVANAIRPDRFTDADAERLAAIGGPAAGAAVAAHRRAREQREQLRRLGADVELPFAADAQRGGADLDALARVLAAALP